MKSEIMQISCLNQAGCSVRDLQRYLADSDSISGDLDYVIQNIADAHNIGADSLDWVHRNNPDPIRYFTTSKARVIIMPIHCKEEIEKLNTDKTVIFTGEPMLLFSRIARDLFMEKPLPGIHPSAVIHPDAKIGKDVYIGPLSYIGRCEIGDNCTIHSHVSIEDNTIIGKNVLIKNGARIGQAGFGFVKNEVGEYEKFPQVGKVVIEDDVEIGANTCIDRGALSITKIGKGTKIDNLTEIAHNVQIGENCIITGNVGIAGSARIGNNVWVGPNSSIRNGVYIGSNAFINMGSIVIRNVNDGEDVIGYPAEKKESFIAKMHHLRRLYSKLKE